MTPPPVKLTDRELDVLRCVARGHRNRTIAEMLCLSTYTVNCHIANIFVKLGVNCRTAAVSRALTLGLISQADIG